MRPLWTVAARLREAALADDSGETFGEALALRPLFHHSKHCHVDLGSSRAIARERHLVFVRRPRMRPLWTVAASLREAASTYDSGEKFDEALASLTAVVPALQALPRRPA